MPIFDVTPPLEGPPKPNGPAGIGHDTDRKKDDPYAKTRINQETVLINDLFELVLILTNSNSLFTLI